MSVFLMKHGQRWPWSDLCRWPRGGGRDLDSRPLAAERGSSYRPRVSEGLKTVPFACPPDPSGSFGGEGGLPDTPRHPFRAGSRARPQPLLSFRPEARLSLIGTQRRNLILSELMSTLGKAAPSAPSLGSPACLWYPLSRWIGILPSSRRLGTGNPPEEFRFLFCYYLAFVLPSP